MGISKVETVWYTIDASGHRRKNTGFEIRYIDNDKEQGQTSKGVDINKKSMYLNQTAVIWVFQIVSCVQVTRYVFESQWEAFISYPTN